MQEKQKYKSNDAPAIKDTVKKIPIKKTENKPAAKSKPVEKKGHWETKTKKVKVGEKKVVDEAGHYVGGEEIGSHYVCDCGWQGSLVNKTGTYGGISARDADEEHTNHKKKTPCHRAYSVKTVYTPQEWIEEKSHMEPVYETRVETIWVED